MVKLWALENMHNNLSICTIDPGKTNTKLRKKANPGEDIKKLQDPIMVSKSIVKIIFADIVYKGETVKIKKTAINLLK